MYAIIDIAGKQEKVEKGKDITVDRIDKKEGSSVKINEVLFASKDGEFIIGNPYIKGAHVEFDIVEHLRGDKVLAFVYRRRKNSKRVKGHRSDLTKLKVKEIKL